MIEMTAFDKAWEIAKELSLHERAAAEEFAHPDDMEGHKLRDKVPSWMNRSKTGELNPRDLNELRQTAATSPFRFYDDIDIEDMEADHEHYMEQKPPEARIAFTLPECENCGAPSEGSGSYGGTQMSLCRGCA